MKRLISAIFLFTSLVMSAATYYVAPNGNDNNPGTISQPWATWQKGFNSVSAGDILYIRGGTYTGMYGSGHGVRISSRDGSSSNPITVSAYPGEIPVLDCSSLASSSGVNYGILMSGCDNWRIKGLTVKNVREYRNLHKSVSGAAPTAGWELSNCNNITIERCIVTACGNGFTLNGTLHDIHYINCDAYDNYDYYDSGGLANGFNGNMRGNSTIYYDGCRAWSNSDDGYDNFGGAGYMTYNNCWAYRNGYDTPTSGNGDGFKLGYDRSGTELSGSQRTMYNCISADNKLMGYDESMDGVTSMDMEIFNCIAYRNANDFGFKFSTSSGTGRTTLRNNIAYANGINYKGRTRNISDHNTWDAGAPSVSSSDFQSLETSQLVRPRKADGSLPDITFGMLATGSDLIDAGINIGRTYTGTAPDIGAYELRSTVIPPTTTLQYQSAEVKNTNPSELEVTYNLTLAPVVPSTSCYEVKVNSAARTISKLIISANKVYLTLSSPVNPGETITLSYNKPATNPLQCTGGSIAETVTGKTVLNSLIAAAPNYLSSEIQDKSPDKLLMTYDTKLSSTVLPAASSFTAKVNGVKISVTSVAIAENMVTLTLGSNVEKNDTVTIAYTQPSSSPLQTLYGGKAETLAEQQVQNNILGVPTGTEDTINDGKTLIFPNPAKEYIKIANLSPGDNKTTIQFFDLSGKLCQETKLDNLTKNMRVPVRLKPGMYISRITVGETVHHVQKLIVVN